LLLEPLGSADIEILRDLLEQHQRETGSPVAEALLVDVEKSAEEFVKVLPRDYAAVMETRKTAAEEGLDLDGDEVWNRIMEVTGG